MSIIVLKTWSVSFKINIWESFLKQVHHRAIYTCIKKPESFVHSGFSWEVARQLPLNTAKNPNRKTHLRSGIFLNSAGFSGFFCQCKRLLQSRRYYSVFGHVVRDLLRNHPTAARDVMRTTYGQRQREVAHAHLLPKKQYEIRVFSRMRFSCQKTRMLWVFLAV